MKYKLKAPRVVFLIFAVVTLLIIAAVSLLPLWHVVMSSISNPTYVTTHKGLVFWPLENFDAMAYKLILGYKKLWVGYGYTILYIVLSCVITGFLTIIAGYVFSRNRFRYRNAFMMIISFTMLFNGGMIPTYMVIQKLHMVDTIWAMVIPGSLNVFNIIMMRTSMQGISDALEDAARIDGANDFVIMFKVILPLCKATFAVIILFTIVYKWNDFMIYIRCRWCCEIYYSSRQRKLHRGRMLPVRLCMRRILNMRLLWYQHFRFYVYIHLYRNTLSQV